MATRSEQQYKSLKFSRWVALFIKIITLPILQVVFVGLKKPMILPITKGESTQGQFLALFITLIIYYGVIFVINRNINFKQKTDLKKSLAVYILVVLILFTLEQMYANPVRNALYNLTPFGLKDPSAIASIANAKNQWVYLGISLGVTLAISLITKRITFWLFKYVLSNQKRLDQI